MGSTGYVTDANAAIYEHIEYFPFGETWVEEAANTYQRVPYRFTGKELDEETGLYYYGARYYDPRTSVWQSADPILGKYLPTGNKKQDAQLPGMGGVFNSLNLGMYNYAGLNPIILVDPDGNAIENIKGGIASGTDVTINLAKVMVRPKMKSVNAIVLHRTVSSTARSAINTAIKHKGKTGFHIVVGKKGDTTQIVNFDNRANHVGKPKGSVNNFNSIGVEVVGNYNAKTKKWDPLTPEQIESTAQAVYQIMKEYNIGLDKVTPHENESRKTAGEGQTVLDAIKPRLQELLKPPAPKIDE